MNFVVESVDIRFGQNNGMPLVGEENRAFPMASHTHTHTCITSQRPHIKCKQSYVICKIVHWQKYSNSYVTSSLN